MVYEGTVGERAEAEHCDTTDSENNNEVDRRASSRIDEKAIDAFVDRISVAMLHAQVSWIEHRDRAQLRRALIALVAGLEE